jgi:hypothetical protein
VKMFLAVGLDMALEPCRLVVMDKTGKILESRDAERPIDCIAYSIEALACSSGKTVFCAISEKDAYEFEPHICRRLRERRVYIKTYDHCYLIRMENMMMDLKEGISLRAYCLAKIVQAEGLDLTTYREEIEKLYDMREILDRVLINLSTIHAFPDDYHLLRR